MSAISKAELVQWHTGEAYNHLANDEYLYNKAIKCKRWQSLVNLWRLYLPRGTVNMRYVNWREVYTCLQNQ